MPSRKYHLLFDEELENNRAICKGRDGNAVHKFMDKGARKWGAQHRVVDPDHDAEMIRPWIAAQVKRLGVIKQDTATDYVRIAWGHIVLDYVVSKEKDRRERPGSGRPRDAALDWPGVHTKAWRSFKKAGFHKSRYRGPNRAALEKAGDWLFGRGDKARA